MDGRHRSVGGHRDLYHRRWIGRRHLHRPGADDYFAAWRGGAHLYRPRKSRRFCRAAGSSSRQLFPHDAPVYGRRVSVDGNIFRRAHPGHLVLVYGPGDRAARAFRQGRRPRESGNHFRGISQSFAGISAGGSGTDCFRALSANFHHGRWQGHQWKYCFPGVNRQSLAHGHCGADDCRAARGADGSHELGIQFGVDDDHPGFLQKGPAGGQ